MLIQPITDRRRRRGRVFPEYNLPPEELARLQAEIDNFGLRCKPIWQKACPELIENHYNWFMTIEPESGDYFIDPDEMKAYQKARQKYPHSMVGTFRINQTGTCGMI